MSQEKTDIAITGAAGRMGLRLIALAREDGGFNIVGAIEKPDHPNIARDAGEIAGVGTIGTRITHDLKPMPQVLIDFSSPPSTRHWLKTCRDRGIAMLIGTTGLQWGDHAAIDQAAAEIPILQATNMSLGVAVLNRIAAQVAKQLGDDYDIEIVEAHHRFKKDAPSGTALSLADSILKATGKGRDALVHGRQGDDATRERGKIGMHSLRMGDEVGRHTAYFAALGERLELTHVATNRDTFVHGALRAAKWLATQKPGRYTIDDVLGMS
ncbi:MAG: 4-hydroxy-tetrahydrodipicolinate reductase [Phycisphaerales bacterium]|jgi:4-hydroxy-tetrahydrodipicolinate reductase|nr:4-hydroxy-tetrahydrodipicolinate reductase [Phycisphaerales bacterium]